MGGKQENGVANISYVRKSWIGGLAEDVEYVSEDLELVLEDLFVVVAGMMHDSKLLVVADERVCVVEMRIPTIGRVYLVVT